MEARLVPVHVLHITADLRFISDICTLFLATRTLANLRIAYLRIGYLVGNPEVVNSDYISHQDCPPQLLQYDITIDDLTSVTDLIADIP